MRTPHSHRDRTRSAAWLRAVPIAPGRRSPQAPQASYNRQRRHCRLHHACLCLFAILPRHVPQSVRLDLSRHKTGTRGSYAKKKARTKAGSLPVLRPVLDQEHIAVRVERLQRKIVDAERFIRNALIEVRSDRRWSRYRADGKL